jgi:hypothetical protein
MANKRPSFLKRQKEQKRTARAAEKREMRKQRKQVRPDQAEDSSGTIEVNPEMDPITS